MDVTGTRLFLIGRQVLPAEPPLDPNADEARDWVLRELIDPAYANARPTLWDEIARAIWEWLQSLSVPEGDGPSTLALAIVGALIGAGILLALLIYGLPRWNRRSRAGALFGEDDTRDAAALRRSAQDAAATGRWADAIADRFRAIARDLTDRTFVAMTPGTTAHGFGAQAGGVFPAESAALRAAADAFDGVRYLNQPGSSEVYDQVTALDERLRSARPAELPTVGSVVPR